MNGQCVCGVNATSFCSWRLRSGPRAGLQCNLGLCANCSHHGLCLWHRKLSDEDLPPEPRAVLVPLPYDDGDK